MIKLLDVGGRDGIPERWKPFYGEMDVLAFEPDPVEWERLTHSVFPYRVKHSPYALGERDGESAILYITRQPGCSSLYLPNYDLLSRFEYGRHLEVVRSEKVTLRRLDTICADVRPDVIKIDTQGTELSILKGAGELLRFAIGVELEVEFIPLYQGQPLFCDIDQFMRSAGFTLRALRRTYWREKVRCAHPYGGQLVHGDALYLNEGRMDSEVAPKVLAAYRQYDLVARLGAHDLIPAQSRFPTMLAPFLRRIEHSRLRRWLDSLRLKTASDWQDPDFF